MGCDIHIIAEVKIDGKWEENTDEVFPSNYPEEGSMHADPDSGRSYDWFAILADVRNGRGFAGVKTGDGFEPIDDPRGVPDDASESWKETVENWDMYMHSHSYLTAEDFEEYDWSQVTTKQGIVSLDTYRQMKRKGLDRPTSYNTRMSGTDIKILSTEQADEYIKNHWDGTPGENIKHYVKMHWPVTYSDWFKHQIENTVEPLKKLRDKYGEARICFGFDN